MEEVIYLNIESLKLATKTFFSFIRPAFHSPGDAADVYSKMTTRLLLIRQRLFNDPTYFSQPAPPHKTTLKQGQHNAKYI